MRNGSQSRRHGGAPFACSYSAGRQAVAMLAPPVASEGAPMTYVLLGFAAYGLGLLTMALLASASRIDECPTPPETGR